MHKILIVEDEPAMRLGMSHLLTTSGYEVYTASDGLEGSRLIDEMFFDLILTDLRLPKLDGLSLLQKVKEKSSSTGVIIITAYADVKTAVEAMKLGAFDYVSKPFSNEELLLVLDKFLHFKDLKEEVNQLKQTLREKRAFDKFIGNSPKMQEVFDKISAVAPTDVSVLIQGQSGTGKELVANAIQSLSHRKDKPFVKMNCAAIPESMFEDELFGHEKGAFTSASELRKGKLEAANTGTIFFDEIADMPLSMQAKLLRVIEDKCISRLGSNSIIKVDVRFLYATSKNLTEAVKEGRFRDDLYHRINVVRIVLPPLHERKEDIASLVDYFLQHFGQKYGRLNLKLSTDAYQYLLSRHYTGNVRELKHLIERAVLLCKSNTVSKHDLCDEYHSESQNTAGSLRQSLTLAEKLRQTERDYIASVLELTGGKKQETAKILGISRKALWEKIKEHGL